MQISKQAQSVYNILTQIPAGKVTTYGAIGKKLKLNPRQVGRILHNNPDPENYPCHRVVFADGKLANFYAFGGLVAQRQLLEEEGITFDHMDRVTANNFMDC